MHRASQQPPVAYRGRRTDAGAVVEAESPAGIWHELDPRLDLRNHSPTGFEWGFGGSGPAQLALALAASRLPDTTAPAIYQHLKRTLVAGLDRHRWQLTGDALDEQLVKHLSANIADDLQRPR
jgi:Family of unknown function (DUF6166)